jgi:restriction system protein
MAQQVWVVRAGRDSLYVGEFLSKSMVAIGWAKLGDLSRVRTKEEITRLVEQNWPDNNKFQNMVSIGQVYRFREELTPGKPVLTYDSNRRIYHLGEITGEYAYHPEYDPELVHTKAVRWEREIKRDSLSAATKNSLGAISTIFCISISASNEVLLGNKPETESGEDDALSGESEEEAIRKDTEQRALEFLQDRLSKLTWSEMQELVAGLLRAMGYKTRVSPTGPDRGRDIIASPDGLGFGQPRIIVEVKHRRNEAMGAPEIRSFLGGLRQNDNGLYVSTGGFTREARYEGDRSNQNLTLMDADEFGRAILEHYDAMDSEARALLPLKKIYWPI